MNSNYLRNIVDTLSSNGLAKYIELPQIAILGDTSSGKSSVLSALSGIEFPAADQLTTRCPTQIKMSHAEEFKCTVVLHRYESNEIEVVDKEINSVDEIRDVIQDITQMLVDEGQTISDDAIVITVEGPEMPNLTLTDLPGLVRTVGDTEDSSIIARVRALVNRYLDQGRTIILAVCPANVDIHNNEILAAAAKVDPKGDRTIAIITKPDLIDKGAETPVLRLLLNEIVTLQLGYHMVKGRGQQELLNGISLSEAAITEKEYFQTAAPWNTVQATLLGIGQLRIKLVRLLEQRIRLFLPAVRTEIRNQKQQTLLEIESLGVAMDSIQTQRRHSREVIDHFVRLMKDAIKGNRTDGWFSDPDNRLRALIIQEDKKFQAEIALTRIPVNSDFEKGDEIEFLYDWKWYHGILKEINGKKFKIFHNDEIFEVPEQNLRGRLKETMKLITMSRGDQIEIFPPYELFVALVTEKIEKWREPTQSLVSEYQRILQKVCNSALEYCSSGHLKLHFIEICENLIRDLAATAGRESEKNTQAELLPHTLNGSLKVSLNKLRAKPFLDSLKAHADESIPVSTVRSLWESFGLADASSEESEAHELSIASSVYLKIAKIRYTDNIPSIINAELLQNFVVKFNERCHFNDEELRGLLQEDDHVRENRERLQAKLATLEAADSLMVRRFNS